MVRLLIALWACGVVALAQETPRVAQTAPAAPAAQTAPTPASRNPFGGFPDLVAGLKGTPGCLGVETARTSSGKNVIFAWFENKKAVLSWYYSEAHQKAMKMGFTDASYKPSEPLVGVPDNSGPIMAIASLTISDKPKVEGSPMPISQIAIELYQPLTGGIFFGGRFAPEKMKVPNMRDYTPKP